MSGTYQADYLEFLGLWESRGGAPPRNIRLGSFEGQAYVQAVKSLSHDQVCGCVASTTDEDIAAGLLRFLRSVKAPRVEVVSEGPPARSVAEILADPPVLQLTSTTAVEAAWSDLLGYWVRNRGFPEDEARMRQAFLDAVQRRGLEEVAATTRHYATRVASVASSCMKRPEPPDPPRKS